MNIPGGDVTCTEAAKQAFAAWSVFLTERIKKTPEWHGLDDATREAWTAAVRLAVEAGVIAAVTDLAIWAEDQGDLGAAIAKAVWRYAQAELGYVPPVITETE